MTNSPPQLRREVKQQAERINRLERIVAALIRRPAAVDESQVEREHPHLAMTAAPDFSVIIVSDRRYVFRGHGQQAILRALWKDSLIHREGLSAGELREKCGSVGDDFRVSKCFRTINNGKVIWHPGWNVLIQRIGNRYSLSGPKKVTIPAKSPDRSPTVCDHNRGHD